ncbi:MAG: pilus assembly protein N-terminal domain-containing protein, partial [Myxococcales bacterium]|nr:pilus assembly protein N-terminal domain-containing protein [Myxococcales bacterium]
MAVRSRRTAPALLVMAVAAFSSLLVPRVVAQRRARPAPDTRPIAETRELSLAVGENRTLSARGVKSYSLGAAGVAEVRLTPDGQQFVVVAKSPGSTTLLGLYDDGREVLWKINVFARSVKSVEDELQQLLGESLGIRVRRVGSRFFIEGGVGTAEEIKRIEHIARLYAGQVETLVVVGG